MCLWEYSLEPGLPVGRPFPRLKAAIDGECSEAGENKARRGCRRYQGLGSFWRGLQHGGKPMNQEGNWRQRSNRQMAHRRAHQTVAKIIAP